MGLGLERNLGWALKVGRRREKERDNWIFKVICTELNCTGGLICKLKEVAVIPLLHNRRFERLFVWTLFKNVGFRLGVCETQYGVASPINRSLCALFQEEEGRFLWPAWRRIGQPPSKEPLDCLGPPSLLSDEPLYTRNQETPTHLELLNGFYYQAKALKGKLG